VLLWAAKVVERIDVLFQVCKTKRLGGAVMLNFLLKINWLDFRVACSHERLARPPISRRLIALDFVAFVSRRRAGPLYRGGLRSFASVSGGRHTLALVFAPCVVPALTGYRRDRALAGLQSMVAQFRAANMARRCNRPSSRRPGRRVRAGTRPRPVYGLV
jgi:hypothetical protein